MSKNISLYLVVFCLGLSFSLPAFANQKTKVDEIFRAKCMDCHSDQTVYPWYADLPIAKQIIGNDIKKGRAYFLLERDFFNYDSLDSLPKHVVKRLEHEIKHDEMPPLLYKLGHLDKLITPEEKKSILSFLSGVSLALVEPLPKKESLNLDSKKVALGRVLYHDKRLSGDNTISCSSCHDLKLGGTDQARVATGINGAKGPINSPTVYNSVYNVRQFWDGRAKDLEEQAHGPVHNPAEMGSSWQEVIAKLEQDKDLLSRFKEVYGTNKITGDMIANSIAEFEKSLITPNSRFDQYLRGDKNALTADEKKGYELFEQYSCTSCHFGPALGGKVFRKMGVMNDYFADRVAGRNGLAKLALSEVDAGLYNFSKKEKDRAFFKVPILRNIELTYPYFHDGNAKDLAKAVEAMVHYQTGQEILPVNRDLVVKFLKTLTDEDLR